MHIISLFSTSIPVCDGIAAHVLGLAKRLQARGHTVTLMTRGACRPGVEEFDYEGLRVLKVPFYPVYPFHVECHGVFVRRALKRLSPPPDLIHLHSPLVPSLPRSWPMVTTFHTPMLPDTAMVENLGIRTHLIKLMGKTTSYWAEMKLLKNSDAIISVSEGVAEELQHYYSYPKNSTRVISNIVGVQFFQPAIRSKEPKKILFIGRLAYRKGLFDLINSAPEVIKEFPEVKYVLVGGGPLEGLLKEHIASLKLEGNFDMVGVIKDPDLLLKYYQAADIFLFPSHYEGCPMVILEALSCGLPIITSKANFSKGILTNHENAVLVEPKNVEQLITATKELLSSPELSDKLRSNARATALKRFAPEENTDTVEQVYQEAIAKFNQRN